MLTTHNNFGLVNLNVAAETYGGFSVLCRDGEPGCENPYTKNPISYESVMLRADFAKLGQALETILRQHA